MSLKNMMKCIFFISCLAFITNMQQDFSLYSSVLTQDIVSLDRASFNLSPQEKIDLNQGKVILKGQKGNYLGRVIAPGQMDIAWEVLTDYNNFDKFLPNIIASKVISTSGNRIVFEQTSIVDLWLFQQEFKVQIEAVKAKPDRVDFKIVDGDLQKLIGRWQIETTSLNNILVSHRVEVEPAGDIEKPFFYGVYESSLEETLQAIALEITKRSQI